MKKGAKKVGAAMSKNTITAGIILAAGQSTRLGFPKQLIRHQGRCLIEIVVEAALSSLLDYIIVVLGHKRKEILRQLEPLADPDRMVIVTNTHYKKGMSGSLQAGLKNVLTHHKAAMFILGDQPLIDKTAINLLLDQYSASSKGICQPVNGDKRGNPTIFNRQYFQTIYRLTGDTGARKIIRTHPHDVHLFETSHPAYFFDIDTEKDIRNLVRLKTNR